MSLERSMGSGLAAEVAPADRAVQPGSDPTPGPLALQILTAEHWSLLASRSLAWNETFSRAGMYLSTLSGATVALALVSQASSFGPEFVWFALLILPVVLFVGVGTYIRQGASNYHDAFCVAGMNRIRAAYFERAPDLRRYFMTSGYDDGPGIEVSMGTQPGRSAGLADLVASTPFMVAALNGVVSGVIAGLIASLLGQATLVVVVVGVLGFAVCLGIEVWYAIRGIARAMDQYQPMFPHPTQD